MTVAAIDTVTIAIEPPDQPEVVDLIAELDAYQASLYPPESNHFVDIAGLCRPEVAFAVARDASGTAIGCAATLMRDGFAEVKRMYVSPQARGSGCGRALLAFVEAAARRRGHRLLRLETGPLQPEALALYERAGYRRRTHFEGYAPDPLSVFMEKTLAPTHP